MMQSSLPILPIYAHIYLQISVLNDIATAFQLESFREVVVEVIPDKSRVALDFIEFSMKDQYISRADMWRLKVTMIVEEAF